MALPPTLARAAPGMPSSQAAAPPGVHPKDGHEPKPHATQRVGQSSAQEHGPPAETALRTRPPHSYQPLNRPQAQLVQCLHLPLQLVHRISLDRLLIQRGAPGSTMTSHRSQMSAPPEWPNHLSGYRSMAARRSPLWPEPTPRLEAAAARPGSWFPCTSRAAGPPELPAAEVGAPRPAAAAAGP